MLGHIISKYGIKIDPSKVIAIQKLDFPRSKKEVQSFLGKVNLLRILISNFVETVKSITNMLKKENEVKWTTESRKSFEDIKRELVEPPVLINPYFCKEFWYYLLLLNTLLQEFYCKKTSKIWNNQFHFSVGT